MTEPKPPALCTLCNKRGKHVCSGCKAIHYCSTACQKTDWPIHKIVCKDYVAFESTTRPDENHHAAIYLSPEEVKPRFTWLRLKPGHSHPSHEDLAVLTFGEDRLVSDGLVYIPVNLVLHRPVEPHHIVMSIPEAENTCPCCTKYTKPSQSLKVIDAELADSFRGAIVAWAVNSDRGSNEDSHDLDLGPLDFRHVVDMLRMTYCNIEDDLRCLTGGGEVKATRMNCQGDMVFLKRSIYEGILLPKSVLLEESEVATPIADKIGIPLIVRKIPPSIVWRNPRCPCRYINFSAAMLNPAQQSSDTGSLLLIRKDGKPLHVVHVIALLFYTTMKLRHPNHPENACITSDMLIPARVDQVSREDFENWYPTLWQKDLIRFPFVPSPFDISDDYDAIADDFVAK